MNGKVPGKYLDMTEYNALRRRQANATHDWRVVGICWPAVWASVKYWLCIALMWGLSMLMGFARV